MTLRVERGDELIPKCVFDQIYGFSLKEHSGFGAPGDSLAQDSLCGQRKSLLM